MQFKLKLNQLIHSKISFWRTALIALPYIWLLSFFIMPFLIIFKISFTEITYTIPPYSNLITWLDGTLNISINFNNFIQLLKEPIYIGAYLQSLKVAALSTLFCLILGYPMAWAMAHSQVSIRNILLLLVILPSWTSFLIRIYAWMGILKDHGIINKILMWLGVINEPIVILYTDLAMYIGMVYTYLPFMVLPLYTALTRLDYSLVEASLDLGARPLKTFLYVIIPLTKGGIVTGSMLVFIPAVGEYVIPELLGSPDSVMIGRILWQEFFHNRDWPMATAIAVVMLVVLMTPIMWFSKYQKNNGVLRINKLPVINSCWRVLVLLMSYAFLYIPILMLVIYSFNKSKLTASWVGWSTQWYHVLIHDTPIMNAVALSVILALTSATVAVLLGTLAAVAMVRFECFPGYKSFVFMLKAQLVVPDIIIGLSLLLFFVMLEQTIGLPKRGLFTIWLAHVTFCTSYVALIVHSSLLEMNKSIEEAAMDLGATPLKTFFIITFPMISPALISSWFLAFTLSLDDLVIASFVTGPGSITLSMLIFSNIRRGMNPEINALATLILTTVTITSFFFWILISKKRKQ